MEDTRLAKDKGACGPPEDPRQAVPESDNEFEVEGNLFHSHDASTARNVTGFDTIQDFPNQPFLRPTIRIDENQPISLRGSSAGIANPGDLMKRLKNHPRAGSDCQFSRAVVRVVVHHDEFCGISALKGGDQGLFNACKGA